MLRCVLFLALAGAAYAQVPRSEARILVQSSPLAGFRHHEGKAVWERMRVGDVLELKREPDNPHDPKAVRVQWQGHMLGYLPRTENADIARQLDHGSPLEARISRMRKSRNGRHRLEFEVYARL